MRIAPKIEKIITGQLLILALACAVLLFLGGPDSGSLRFIRVGWDFGHLFSFALWSYLLLNRFRPASLKTAGGLVFLFAVVIGAATEVLQSFVGRNASMADFYHDQIGAALGLVGYYCFAGRIIGFRLWLLGGATVLMLVWLLAPVMQVAVDDLLAATQFPLLSGFETPLEASRWGGSAKRKITRQIAYTGRASLQVEFSTQRYSRVELRDFPRDWRGFAALSMEIYNPEETPLRVFLRVHDLGHDHAYSDRYNTQLDVAHGWHHFSVPLQTLERAPRKREMDLGDIAAVILFVDKLEQPQKIYIDDVRLLPSAN